MNITWLYFSDTNSPPGDIETFLERKQQSLISTNQVEKLNGLLRELEQTVLFLKANSVFNVYELCQEISILHPQTYIILIVPDNMENIKKAMHMGASDILRASFILEEMQEAILQAKKYMHQRAAKSSMPFQSLLKEKSRVISICNPKGGIGRTSVAVNLAAAFARNGKKVAIIDANLQFGDVAMYYNLKPKRTIYEWVKEAYGRSNYTIDQYMAIHESKVAILAAPARPEFFEGITENHLNAAIEEAKKLFDVILIDTPSYLSEIHVCCLEQSDEILLLTTNEISVGRITKLYLETLETLNLKDSVKLIINKQAKNKGLEIKKLEEILDTKVYAALPDQESVAAASIAMGSPFILSNPRSHLGKAIWQLTEKLHIKEEQAAAPRKKEKRWFLVSK
ncbi:AAA family ATPase [Mesobacillus harenae]|uniref:AAA family ATPase n=1 Tax=Mesobacillus harenae TaxID=2213203 RepID=UPI00157FC61C|nr:AAA family ATPase [Mesobacillus harenae]